MSWRKLFLPIAALLSLVALWFRQSTPWKGRAEKAQEKATTAQLEAIDSKADLEKASIAHDVKQALENAGAVSDDDIVAAAVAEYRRRFTRRPDMEGPRADD